ncbi:MAG: nucleotidyl transferase AbiEii/AbiGii toxin family protein [Vulcanimicrobiota bacterium]
MSESEPSIEDYFFLLTDALEANEVDYFVVGGMAVNLHGLVRATEGIDLFVEPSPENIERLRSALRSVWDDPCIEEISSDDLCGDYPVVRYGPPRGRFMIDLMTRVGETFGYSDLESQTLEIDSRRVRVATPETLYKMKRNTVRPRDRNDALALGQKFQLGDD